MGRIEQGYASGYNTDWRVIEGLIYLLNECGIKKIVIGESSIVGADTKEAFRAAGYSAVAARTGAELIDFKQDEITKAAVPKALSLSSISIYKKVLEADLIINLPKLKTVTSVPVSLGMKNLKGVIPDEEKKRFHNTNLNNCIVDLNSVVKPQLTIIDGIIGNDLSQPRPTNILIAGKNVVAVDTIGCLTMGIDPYEVKYLTLAENKNLGTIDKNRINIIGENVDSINFHFKKTSSIQDLKCYFPEINIVSGSACSGCTANLHRTLSTLKEEGYLHYYHGYTFVIGLNPPILKEDKVIFLGNCTKQFGHKNFYPGCPWISMYLIEDLKDKAMGKEL